mgnify:CR=1 FL=1
MRASVVSVASLTEPGSFDLENIENAQIVGSTLPAEMACGQTFDASVTVRNTGGTTWTAMGLEGSEHIARIVLDPRDPDVLYASTHQRFRNVAALINGGPESGIFKSTDAGATWTELTNGLPEEDMGKIGLKQ